MPTRSRAVDSAALTVAFTAANDTYLNVTGAKDIPVEHRQAVFEAGQRARADALVRVIGFLEATLCQRGNLSKERVAEGVRRILDRSQARIEGFAAELDADMPRDDRPVPTMAELIEEARRTREAAG